MRSKSSLRRVDTEGGRSTKSVGFSTRRTRHYRKGHEESPSDSSAANRGAASKYNKTSSRSSPRSSGGGEENEAEPSSLMVSVEEPLSPMDSNTFNNGSEGDSGTAAAAAAANDVRDASPTVGTPNKGGLGGNHTTPLKWIRRTSLTGRSDSSRDDFLGTVPLEFPTQGQAESRPVKENLTSRALPDPSVEEVSDDDVEESISSPDCPNRDTKVPSSALARRQKTPIPSHYNRDDLSPFAESDDEGILSELGDLTEGGTTTVGQPGADSREAVQSVSNEEFQFSQPEGSKAQRPLASFPVPSPRGTDDDDTEMHEGVMDIGQSVGDAVNGIEMDTDMITQDQEDVDEDTWQSPNQEPRMTRPSVGSSQQLSPVLNAGDVDFSPTGVSESYGLGGYETPMTQRNNEAFSSIIPSSASQNGMLSEEMPTSVKRMRKGSGKKSIVSRTELKRILRHSSYSDDGEASDFMESNGSRQMAGGFEISEIDEASKENFDMEQSSIPFRNNSKSYGLKDGKRQQQYYMTPGAVSDWSMTGPTQEWHVPVIDDTIQEEEEGIHNVSPTQVIQRPTEGGDIIEEEDHPPLQQGGHDAYAIVEKAQSLFYEVVESVAGGGVTDDLEDVLELLDRTTEKMASEGAEVSELIVTLLCNDLKRRTAAIKRKIEIADMQQLEVKRKLANHSRDRILKDIEVLGGWSEDVEDIFRERCKSAVVETPSYCSSTTVAPYRVREDLLRYWGDIMNRFTVEGELMMEDKRREELEAECRLQDARVCLAEQETRAAEIIRRYGRQVMANIENNGEGHAEVLIKAVDGGYIRRTCKELEDKQEKDIKNLAKLMESRDVVVKEKEELEAKLAERQKVLNWHKCREYWGAVLRGYRELPCEIPRARKFETASGLIVVVIAHEPADVQVHGSSSRRDVSLPNGKFDCVWKAIASRAKTMLREGASLEDVIIKVVEYGDRVGRLQESARALGAEKALGTCSRILCTERGKLVVLHRVEVPRGLGTRPASVAHVDVGVVLMTPYIDWEGNGSNDYRLDDVLVRHPFPLPIGGDLFAVGVRMHVMDALAKLMEGSDANRRRRNVKDNLAALVSFLSNSLSKDKLALLRDRAIATMIGGCSNTTTTSSGGLNNNKVIA